MNLPPDQDPYVALARYSLETHLRTGQTPPTPQNLPGELTSRRAGAFVSLHRGGRLRGCIGTISPTRESLAEEIMHNAVSAGTADPRFAPLSPAEMEDLEVKVDVLGEPEDVDGINELDAKRYGVIVSAGFHRGLLLPDLEGVDTPAQQLDIALRKAGIPEGVPYSVQRFKVVRHV